MYKWEEEQKHFLNDIKAKNETKNGNKQKSTPSEENCEKKASQKNRQKIHAQTQILVMKW